MKYQAISYQIQIVINYIVSEEFYLHLFSIERVLSECHWRSDEEFWLVWIRPNSKPILFSDWRIVINDQSINDVLNKAVPLLLSRASTMTEPLLDQNNLPENYSAISSGTTEQMPATYPSSYPGQDKRPTSTRELLGWYSYIFASEVYAVVSLCMFSLGSA